MYTLTGSGGLRIWMPCLCISRQLARVASIASSQRKTCPSSLVAEMS